tara:strand:+ start:226 stop:1011 length:786 start_codon:yes stop_codon:yes gene_type:complete
MNFNFDKYHGAGNDFVIIDDREETFPDKETGLIQKICDRHFGIGADGFILMRTSYRSNFKMLYFNSDGKPSSLCGNGSRCVYAFAQKQSVVGSEGTFETLDGIYNASINDDHLVSIHMGDVSDIEKRDTSVFLDTGSPHHIEFVDDVAEVNVKERGAAIRYGSPYFEVGSNANFVEKLNEREFKIRTYERGVEYETLACGTGAVAAAIAAHSNGLTSVNVLSIHALGGELQVSFTIDAGRYKNIHLTGPADFVYSGNISLK